MKTIIVNIHKSVQKYAFKSSLVQLSYLLSFAFMINDILDYLVRDPDGTVEYKTKIVKFSSVHHLTLHFPSNFGDDKTKVKLNNFCLQMSSSSINIKV